ncbi:MAG TPA: hypothetical protein VMV26_10995 [Alphaproteobacteria bacterium]|nr:hypothetical protein [Alphaproteobacteria bacterium]
MVARLFGGLLDWRRREADRTIGRYDYLICQSADLYRIYEAEITRPEPAPGIDKTDALRRGIVVPDCA